MLRTDSVTDPLAWDQTVRDLGGHPLQLWGWGEVKATGAWRPVRIAVHAEDGAVVGGAQVLVRRLPWPFGSLAYVPRGPFVGPDGRGDDATRAAVTSAVVERCRALGALGATLEPDWDAGTALGVPDAVPSEHTILFPSTLVLDLTRSPDELLAAMSRSTRYDVRKAERSGLEVRRVVDEAEVRGVLDVYRGTAERAGFALHDDDYYLAIHRELGDASVLVAAFDEGRPCAFVWGVSSATTSFELYGGVDDAGRRLRANAPVKWHAIRLAAEAGLTRYDMNGLLNDGISDFKRSFAQHTDELVGSFDVPFSRLRHGLWNRALPTAKRVLRALRRR